MKTKTTENKITLTGFAVKVQKFLFILCLTFYGYTQYNCSGNANKTEGADAATTQGTNTQKAIVNKWQWDSWKNDMMDSQLASMKKQADSTKDPDIIASYKMTLAGVEVMKKHTMEFSADSSFEAVRYSIVTDVPQAVTLKGKWSLSSDGKKLTTTWKIDSTDNPRSDVYEVVEASANKLVLSFENGMVIETWKVLK